MDERVAEHLRDAQRRADSQPRLRRPGALHGHPVLLARQGPEHLAQESPYSTEPASFYTGAASTLLTRIWQFPWQPSEATEATVWIPDFPSGPTHAGSEFQHLVITDPRRGSTGSGSNAWACQPTANYANGTVSWLHSPIFDFSVESPDACGLELRFELWIRSQENKDGMKLQVSTNGGSTWSDVTPLASAYNGATSTSNVLASNFGGSNSCWWGKSSGSPNPYGGTSAVTASASLATYAGMSDVRFRFCFGADGSTNNSGPVVDGLRVIRAASGVTPMYQGLSQSITITGTGFTGATALSFQDPLITVSNFTVVNDTTITATATLGHLADAGRTCFTITKAGGNIEGTAPVVYPTDILPNPDDTEPVQNAAVGGVSVFLKNGEFFL